MLDARDLGGSKGGTDFDGHDKEKEKKKVGMIREYEHKTEKSEQLLN